MIKVVGWNKLPDGQLRDVRRTTLHAVLRIHRNQPTTNLTKTAKGLAASMAIKLIESNKRRAAQPLADGAQVAGLLSELDLPLEGPAAVIASLVHAANEKQAEKNALEEAVRVRRGEKHSVFARLILSDEQGPRRNAINETVYDKEVGHLTRLGASVAAAKRWLQAKAERMRNGDDSDEDDD